MPEINGNTPEFPVRVLKRTIPIFPAVVGCWSILHRYWVLLLFIFIIIISVYWLQQIA